jgi:hypothetical protein
LQVDPTAAVETQVPVRAVRLRPGASVVGRVVEPAGSDGRGQLALAGVVVKARLPPGLRRGQRLPLHVSGQIGEQLVLKLVRDASSTRRRGLVRLASSLATRRDGDLLRVALSLTAGGTLPLPGRRFAAVESDAGANEEDGEEPRAPSIALTLHTPELGAVELSLRLVVGALLAVAVVDEDKVAVARTEAPGLAERLGVATGLAATVVVQPRHGPAPPPPVEAAESEIERYA